MHKMRVSFPEHAVLLRVEPEGDQYTLAISDVLVISFYQSASWTISHVENSESVEVVVHRNAKEVTVEVLPGSTVKQ